MAADILGDFVDSAFAAETAFLAELVKIPSDNPPGDCAPHAERAMNLLQGLGFAVERHAVPEATCRAAGMISATNLVVRHRFSADGPTIALNAHGDVVPPGEGWTTDPYGAEIRDGWMYGRGVAVSKSDFATYAFALIALKRLAVEGAALRGGVELHFTYDEEVGGEIGPKWLLDQGLSRPDAAICAGFSYQVVTAHNGCLHLDVQVDGKSAHAARPDTGHDALEAATTILSALYESRRVFASVRSQTPGIEHPTLVVGLISGGVNTNVVPDRVNLRLDRRLIPEEQPEQVERDLRALIAEAAAALPGITVSVRRILLAVPFRPIAGAQALADLVGAHGTRIMGEVVAPTGVPLYTDARHYAAAGIPTILYGAGPRSMLEANAHRADERLPLEDLRKATKIIACVLKDYLS
jgi:succinyl-diaminopimelate desuccinylase